MGKNKKSSKKIPYNFHNYTQIFEEDTISDSLSLSQESLVEFPNEIKGVKKRKLS